MMEKNGALCMGCMSPIGQGISRCPRCSYDNAIPNPRGALPAGTVLEERYVVGRVVRRSDLTITYLGLHRERGIKVYIEEFYPEPLVEREGDGCTIRVSEERRIRFKTLYSDMADRWKQLSKLDSRSFPKIRELFSQWGTLYCVTPYMPYHTLEQQIEENGPLSWGEAKAAFLPLCTLVANLHNGGLTHCGVSPENILVNRRGQLLLIGFSLPELRTEGSGLTPELYSGYSAPEQYSRDRWQGEWTDVYSLGAVLYYILTAVAPLSAPDRLKKDTLPDAAAVKETVPDNVSEALVKALEPTKQRRFSTVNEFTAALLQETASNTAVFSAEAAKPEPPAKATPWSNGKRPSSTMVLGAALAISLIVNVVLGVLATGGVTGGRPQIPDVISSEVTALPMGHSLRGLYLKEVEDNAAAYGGLVFQAEYDYNESYPENIIYDQSVKVGEPLPEDGTVVLKVSKGSKYLPMPYLIGSSANFASKTLTDLGVSFDFVDDYNPDSSGVVGTVTATNKGFGAKISREGDHVVLTVKREPPGQPIP